MSETAIQSPPPVPLDYEPRPLVERANSKSFVAHAKLIGFFTLISRVLGLAREVVAGHYLGTGLVASAFTVAFTIPNLFRKLFGEGALSAAFIPLYAQALKAENAPCLAGDGASPAKDNDTGLSASPGRHGPAQRGCETTANDFAAASVNLLCLILLGITVAGELLLAAWMLLERDMDLDRMLTLRLTAIMLPYVLLICGTAFLSGILQVHRRFGPPAFAPVLLNVCHIVVVFVGASLLGLHGRNANSAHVVALQTTLSYWLAFFVLVAGVLQWMILLPALRATGFRFKLVPRVWTPMVRRMLKLTVPVAMGAGVLQLSVLLDKGISIALMQGADSAGHLVDHFAFFGRQVRYPMEMGAPARLNLAQFLYQFPLGVFAIALATAIFPSLAGDALEKDGDRFRSALRGGIEATLWEGIPASLGLILVRGPAIRLLFQHGQITAHDADLVGQSVLYYSGAIWAFSLLQIVNRAYYAIHDTVTPLVMSIVNIVLNLVVEIPLLWWLGESAMAVGTLVSFAIQAVVMLVMLDRKVGGLDLRKSLAPLLKMIAAAAAMGLACWGVQKLPMYPHAQNRVSWFMQSGILMAVGGGVYVGACAMMGMGVMEQIMPRRRSRK